MSITQTPQATLSSTLSPTLSINDQKCYNTYIANTLDSKPIEYVLKEYGTCIEKSNSKTDEDDCKNKLTKKLDKIVSVLSADTVPNPNSDVEYANLGSKLQEQLSTIIREKNVYTECIINNKPTKSPPTKSPENSFPLYAIVIIVIGVLLLGAAFYMNKDKIMSYMNKKNVPQNAPYEPLPVLPSPKKSKKSSGRSVSRKR
jgi:hypothetical protein